MAQRGQTVPGIASGAIVNRTIAKVSNTSTSNSKQFTTCTGNADQPIGVFEFDQATGLSVGVIVSGVTKIRAGATWSMPASGRAPITSDATGRAVFSVPGAGVNHGIVGFALEPSTAIGDEVDVLIEPSIFQG